MELAPEWPPQDRPDDRSLREWITRAPVVGGIQGAASSCEVRGAQTRSGEPAIPHDENKPPKKWKQIRARGDPSDEVEGMEGKYDPTNGQNPVVTIGNKGSKGKKMAGGNDRRTQA